MKYLLYAITLFITSTLYAQCPGGSCHIHSYDSNWNSGRTVLSYPSYQNYPTYYYEPITTYYYSVEPQAVQPQKQAPQVKKETVDLKGRHILFFTSKYCIPCKTFINKDMPILVKKGWEPFIVIVDVDKYPELVAKFKVEATPTYIIVEDGKEIDSIEGYVDAAAVTQMWYKNFPKE